MRSTRNFWVKRFAHVFFVAACVPGIVLAVPNPAPEAIEARAINPKEAKAQLSRGLEQLTKGDFAAAEKFFNESIRLDSTQVEVRLLLAEIHLRQGRLDDAEALVRKAMAIKPNAPNILVALGNVLLLKKDSVQAEEMYRKALAINKDHVPAHLGLGELYLKFLNKPQEAITAYGRAVEINPKLPSARLALGSAYAATGQIDKAIAEFQVAAKLAPTDPQAPHAIGRLQVGQKKLDQAVSSFSAALSTNAFYMPALIDRADVLVELGRNQEAAADYASAVARQGDNAQLWLKLGLANDRLQRKDEAIKAYQKAVSINPGLSLAYNNMAWLVMDEKDRFDQALEWATKATSLAPTIPQFHDTLGWIYRARGELDLAQKSLETATQLTPAQADIFYHLGVVLQEQGKKKEAETAFKRALQIDKDFADAADAGRRLGSLAP